MKKVVQEEIEQTKFASTKRVVITSSSGAFSTTVIDVITPIPENRAVEAAKDEGAKVEGDIVNKPIITSESIGSQNSVLKTHLQLHPRNLSFQEWAARTSSLR